MGGVAAFGPGGPPTGYQAPPGTVWSSSAGGFVPVATSPGPGQTAATGIAAGAVTGAQPGGNPSSGSSGQPYTGGGPGSSYTVSPTGQVGYTVTPNLLPQETAATKDINSQQNAAVAALAAQQATAQQGLAKQQSDAESALVAQKAGLSGQAFNQRLSAVSGLSGAAPQVTMGSGGIDPTGARNAAYARAKETAGNQALSALKSVQDIASQRGVTGSTGAGLEGGMMGEVLGGAYGGLNDINREQLIQDLNRTASIQDETYQGNITQRGQDLQRQQAILQLLNAGPLF